MAHDRTETEVEREYALIRLIEAKFDRYVKRIIRDIKRLPKECMLSGADSDLRNVWEEWVVQVQGEHSFSYEAYEDTIRAICREVAKKLPQEEQGLLWLWTDGYWNWDEEEDGTEIPYGDPVLDALEDAFFGRVNGAADDLELPDRLDRYLHPPSDE
jgi:hypothetical protein